MSGGSPDSLAPTAGTDPEQPATSAQRRADRRIRRSIAHVYRLATIDRNGRVADTTVIRALGRAPGTRLDIHENGVLVLVVADRGRACSA